MAVSGLELTQNSIRLTWLGEEVDSRLKIIMKGIHDTCLAAADAYGSPGNYLMGANIAGFVKVADTMLDQGIIKPTVPPFFHSESAVRALLSALEGRVADDYSWAVHRLL